MRVIAGIIGVLAIVVAIVSIAKGEATGASIGGFFLGPVFIAYAWGGQAALERFFPSLAERNRKKKPKH